MDNKEQKNQFIKEKIENHSLFPKSRRTELLAQLDSGEFPVEAFSESIRQWLRYYREQFGYPEAATAMTMLSLLSASIGQQVQVIGASPNGTTPLNIWTVIVACRGSGKSSLLRALSAPIIEADLRAQATFRGLRAKIDAELEFLRSSLPKYKNKNSPEDCDTYRSAKVHERIQALEELHGLSLIIGTPSSEALKRTVAESADHFTLVLSSEGAELFSIMFGKYNEQGKMDLDAWLALKTGDYLNDTRIKRESVTVHRGLISMMLTIQNSVAKELIQNKDALLRGLFMRMYFFDPKFLRTRSTDRTDRPAPVENVLIERMNHFLERRIRSMASRVENVLDGFDRWDSPQPPADSIPCTQSARDAFSRFNDDGIDLEKLFCLVDGNLSGECSRWGEDAIQIAGLLACLEGKDIIDEALAHKAIAIVRWCKKNFLKMLTKCSFDGISDKFERLEYIIEKSENGFVTTGDLKNRHGFTNEDINPNCKIASNPIRVQGSCPLLQP
jgi:hypothetical protein